MVTGSFLDMSEYSYLSSKVPVLELIRYRGEGELQATHSMLKVKVKEDPMVGRIGENTETWNLWYMV